MENTVYIDNSLIVLAIVAGFFLSGYLLKKSAVSFKRLPLFFLSFSGFWSLFNWITHLIAVLIVNVNRMLSDTFAYSYHFYSLIFIGIVFSMLSYMQLKLTWQVNQGHFKETSRLNNLSFGIIALGLPIVPINPLGLLPVICSLIILATIALTRKQWQTPKAIVPDLASHLAKA